MKKLQRAHGIIKANHGTEATFLKIVERLHQRPTAKPAKWTVVSHKISGSGNHCSLEVEVIYEAKSANQHDLRRAMNNAIKEVDCGVTFEIVSYSMTVLETFPGVLPMNLLKF